MERNGLGLVIDIDHMTGWEEAELAARALLRSRRINAWMRLENSDEAFSLIVMALRRIAERTCTIHQAQRVLSSVMRCWDTISCGPRVWNCLCPGHDHFQWKHLMIACKDVVTENRAAYEGVRVDASEPTKAECAAFAAGNEIKGNRQVVRVRAKKPAENPLKAYKVQVACTYYDELTIPAYNEEDAVAIASGNKRMYDGSWAAEHFSPKSHDTYLTVCDGGDSVQLAESECPFDEGNTRQEGHHRGYVATQAKNNNHVVLRKNGDFAAHIQADEPKTEAQLRDMIDDHIRLLELIGF